LLEVGRPPAKSRFSDAPSAGRQRLREIPAVAWRGCNMPPDSDQIWIFRLHGEKFVLI